MLAISSSQLTSHWGYLLLFALIALETSGVPLPGETALIAAGVLASRGDLQIEFVIGLAAAAAIIGDSAGYLIGRHGGRVLLERPGRLERHRRKLIEQGEPFFEKHGPKAVLFARWIVGLRVISAWMAGINRMPWRTFAFWNGLGGISWALSVGLLAYFLGPTVETILQDVGIAGAVLGITVVAAVVLIRRSRGTQA